MCVTCSWDEVTLYVMHTKYRNEVEKQVVGIEGMVKTGEYEEMNLENRSRILISNTGLIQGKSP